MAAHRVIDHDASPANHDHVAEYLHEVFKSLPIYGTNRDNIHFSNDPGTTAAMNESTLVVPVYVYTDTADDIVKDELRTALKQAVRNSQFATNVHRIDFRSSEYADAIHPIPNAPTVGDRVFVEIHASWLASA